MDIANNSSDYEIEKFKENDFLSRTSKGSYLVPKIRTLRIIKCSNDKNFRFPTIISKYKKQKKMLKKRTILEIQKKEWLNFGKKSENR